MTTLLRPRRIRASPGRGVLRRRDLEMLAWVGEQYAARADQLKQLLGCGQRTVQRTLARLRAEGMLSTRRLLVGEPAWVLPTAAGLRACGSTFGVWQPRIGLLAHIAAVNDVRLHVQTRSHASVWTCERFLARDRAAGEHLPDGAVALDGQRVAIEIELTVKSLRRTTAILDELASRFDSVLYFCAPAPHRQLAELAATQRWPTLGVRELAQASARELP
jgi:DNA-binding CsgD family transcriptional regulator